MSDEPTCDICAYRSDEYPDACEQCKDRGDHINFKADDALLFGTSGTYELSNETRGPKTIHDVKPHHMTYATAFGPIKSGQTCIVIEDAEGFLSVLPVDKVTISWGKDGAE